MNADQLREAIRALFESHPRIEPSPNGHAKHAERYITANGLPIGFEPARVRHQNIWVRSDSVRMAHLMDIDHEAYDHRNFNVSKPNHDLYGEPAFKDADLTCFKVKNLWDAVRVVAEVASRTALT